MKRVTIYVGEKVWDEIKDYAWRRKVSAGNYLVGLHESNRIPDFEETPEPDIPEKQIEMKKISKKTLKKNVGVIEKLKEKVISETTAYFNPQLKKK